MFSSLFFLYVAGLLYHKFTRLGDLGWWAKFLRIMFGGWYDE